MTVPSRRQSWRLPVLALALAFPIACMQNQLPGEPVGTYRVTGQLEQNSCGSTAVPAADPLQFEVQILDDDGSGVWALDDNPFVYGDLTEEGDFSFKTETSYALEQNEVQPATTDEEEIARLLSPERESQPSPCVLVQVETVEGTLNKQEEGEEEDAGADDEPSDDEQSDDEQSDGGEADEGRPDLEGENRIQIQPAPGSSCTRFTSAQGGVFLTLPCEISYTLQGQLQ